MLEIIITDIKGSAPCALGAKMWYDGVNFLGTIGGGDAEFQAMQDGINFLKSSHESLQKSYILGGTNKQCCGGKITALFQKIPQDQVAIRAQNHQLRPQKILLIGAGHVGQEVALLLQRAKFVFDWLDVREEYRLNAKNIVQNCKILSHINKSSGYDYSIIMAHNHEYDLQFCYDLYHEKLIKRRILLLGSESKSAKMRHLLKNLLGEAWVDGESKFECPIGSLKLNDKSPFSVALQVVSRLFMIINEDKNEQ